MVMPSGLHPIHPQPALKSLSFVVYDHTSAARELPLKTTSDPGRRTSFSDTTVASSSDFLTGLAAYEMLNERESVRFCFFSIWYHPINTANVSTTVTTKYSHNHQLTMLDVRV